MSKSGAGMSIRMQPLRVLHLVSSGRTNFIVLPRPQGSLELCVEGRLDLVFGLEEQ